MIKTKNYLMLSLAFMFIAMFALGAINNTNKASAVSEVNTTDKFIYRDVVVGDNLFDKDLYIDHKALHSGMGDMVVCKMTNFDFTYQSKISIYELSLSAPGSYDYTVIEQGSSTPDFIVNFKLPIEGVTDSNSYTVISFSKNSVGLFKIKVENPDYINLEEPEPTDVKTDLDKIKDWLKTDSGIGTLSFGTLIVGAFVLNLIFKRR